MPNPAKKTAHAGVGAARARWERAAARTDAIVTNAAHDAITAERSLRAEVKERQEPPARGKGLHSRMTVRDAAAVWLARMEASDRSAKTKRVYRDAVAGCLLPADIANLTLSEANRVATVAAYLQDVSSAHGGGAAKQGRTVLSGVLQLAVDGDSLPLNAARGVRVPRTSVERISEQRAARLTALDIPGKEWARDTDRALSREQRGRRPTGWHGARQGH